MKITRQYLFSALFPAVTVLIVGLVRMTDCGQCVILLMVGAGLMFLLLLLLGLSYFLMRLEFLQTIPRMLLGIFAVFIPPVIVTWYMVTNYYEQEKHLNTDFEVFGSAIIPSFIISIWTFYLYIKDK